MDAILDAGLRLPATFSALDLAVESGTSIGSIYHHFGSLDAVRSTLLQRCLTRLLDTLVDAVLPKTDLESGIDALVAAYLHWTRDFELDARFLHFGHALTTDELESARVSRVSALVRWLTRFVDELVPLPAALFEMLLIGPLAETARRWLVRFPGVDLDQAITALPPRLLASIHR